MLNRFNQGTIVDYVAGEDIVNNDMYVLDKVTNTIRKPVNCDEWLLNQLVYVLNVNTYDASGKENVATEIKKGTICRCWHCYLIL